MELPTIYELAKEVAEKAFDEITYEGKTLREWVEIIVKQQSCKNYIGKEALIDELKLGYFNKELQEAKNDPCVIDAMIDWAIRTVKRQPSVTPKTSCESCREQVLKHLEKEDWADTVNCVMNMPFMKGEELKETKVCMRDDIDKEDISKSVVLLDLFMKTFCRYRNDIERFGDLRFRCSECPFYKDNGDCLIKIFKNKYMPDYREFGSMGDL